VIDGRVGIAGLGLIGGSIGLRARAAGLAVIGYDRDAEALARALARGAIDAAAPDLAALAAGCATLVIALPVDATCAVLASLTEMSGPALIVDVASVKVPPARAGALVANYVGTHPMAGSERAGIEAARSGLFINATWAYMPHPDESLLARARELIVSMGAVPLEIDPGEHDAIVALTSHLPQALSVLLGAALASAIRADRRVFDLCGPGMLSMLRLARSPESMWEPIVAANALPIAGQLRSTAQALLAAAAGLESGESAALMSYFTPARDAAHDLEKRFMPGARSSTYP
jgi:prephenate dehydrogenase